MARRRRRLAWLWLIAPVLLLALLCGRGRDGARLVLVSVAGTGMLEQRASGTGRLEGLTRVEISAARMGLIDSIAVSEGDVVAEGDLLLMLETSEARASVEEAWASGYSAQIAWRQAEREAGRIRTLAGAGLASSEELSRAEEAVQTAWASLLRARALETIAEEALSRTTYTAPTGGVVTSLNVEEGEMAVVGTMNNPGTVLLTIEDMSRLLVRVTMVESEVVDVREGMPSEISLDAIPDTTFGGVVRSVGLASSNDMAAAAGGVAEYEVTVELESTDPRMRSGMSASVEIITATVGECVHVPVQCVVPRPDPADSTTEIEAVLVVEDGRVRTVGVTTGIMGMMDIEVSGVSEGDSVVSGPVEALRELVDGDRVRTEDAGRTSRS